MRASRVRLVIADNDGTLTDGAVYYSARGEELKRYSLRDGMGVERLRDAGIRTAILTRERSDITLRRAEKLRIEAVWRGVRDKAAELPALLEQTGLSTGEVAYIGDDVNDLGVMLALRDHGLLGAPADAMPEVRAVAHFVSAEQGGHGAFRSFAEWLLRLRG